MNIRNNLTDPLFLIPNFKKENIYELKFSKGCKGIKANNIFIAEKASDIGSPLPKKIFKFLIPYMTMPSPDKKYEKIYISRRKTNTNSRKLINVDEVSKIIVNNGFHEIFCEELTFQEKVYIFYNCKEVICEIGAGLHNCLVCKKNVKFIIMLQKNDRHESFLKKFDSVLNDNPTRLIKGVSLKKGVNTPWKLNINKLKTMLRSK